MQYTEHTHTAFGEFMKKIIGGIHSMILKLIAHMCASAFPEIVLISFTENLF